MVSALLKRVHRGLCPSAMVYWGRILLYSSSWTGIHHVTQAIPWTHGNSPVSASQTWGYIHFCWGISLDSWATAFGFISQPFVPLSVMKAHSAVLEHQALRLFLGTWLKSMVSEVLESYGGEPRPGRPALFPSNVRRLSIVYYCEDSSILVSLVSWHSQILFLHG